MGEIAMDSMSACEFLGKIDELIASFLKDAIYTHTINLGLDARSGEVFVRKDCIIVKEKDDIRLRIFGDFDAIEEKYRKVICDYVIYSNHNFMVRRLIDHYYKHH
jgi:hypothetical protein